MKIVDGLELGYTHQEIAASKVGSHTVRWSPNGEAMVVRVIKVRGYNAWVETDTSPSVKLNRGATRLLMEGKYRSRGV